MDVQGIRYRADHLGPEALALDQRNLDALAAGDVAETQSYRVIVLKHLRQAHHQPQVALVALRRVDAGFQFQLGLTADHGGDQLEGVAATDQAVAL